MKFETSKNAYTVSVNQDQINEGLRNYMLSVYNYMASALALTGIVAMTVSSSSTLMHIIFGTSIHWIVMISPVILVFFLSFRMNTISLYTAQLVFWTYAILIGLSLSSVFLVYTGESIARTFFITASTFASMSFYGYMTKNDISKWENFLFMGIFGILLAGILNMFLASTILQFLISAIGVLVFTGLAAYDTQRIKNTYIAYDSQNTSNKKAIFGALQLYMDFINLFTMLIQFLGTQRE